MILIIDRTKRIDFSNVQYARGFAEFKTDRFSDFKRRHRSRRARGTGQCYLKSFRIVRMKMLTSQNSPSPELDIIHNWTFISRIKRGVTPIPEAGLSNKNERFILEVSYGARC